LLANGFEVALALGTLFYGTVVAWLWTGVRRSRRDPRRSMATPSVSVVVAARNEAHNISACLQALERQSYSGTLQIVVVDDRSTDDTGAIAGRILQRWDAASELLVLRAPDTPRYVCPKKSALAAGIEASGGDLLLFTDADCEPGPAWVAQMVARFSESVGLVAGFACTEPMQHHRHRLLAVDNLGVSALAEGSIGMGAPLSCTGRSLAYRRAVWEEVGGFDDIGHLLSGDDVYFLRLVAARTKWHVVYCADEVAVVSGVTGPTGMGAIIGQKIRHASKASRYRGGARWLGLALYGYHALLLAGIVQLLLTGTSAMVFIVAWLSRWGMDAALLYRFAPRKRRDRVLLTFLPAVEILYLPYVLILVPLGRRGRFRWKEAGSLPATGSDQPIPEETN
jgi:cellulose synthase/poly-beta-1,6-N-acetylglucosamine synthase-like glycosyltransferase